MHVHGAGAGLPAGAQAQRFLDIAPLRESAMCVEDENVVVTHAAHLELLRLVASGHGHPGLVGEVRAYDRRYADVLQKGKKVERLPIACRARRVQRKMILLAHGLHGADLVLRPGLAVWCSQRAGGLAPRRPRRRRICGLQPLLRGDAAVAVGCGRRHITVESRGAGRGKIWLPESREHGGEGRRVRIRDCSHWVRAHHDEARDDPATVVGRDPLTPPAADEVRRGLRV
mmetsp:Transcript_41878/g.121048  ORF Transcript_41878/g.121048 Transcript_41878/m.121048 type:complete len:229 (-) Transcript_41878:584-1270(-)